MGPTGEDFAHAHRLLEEEEYEAILDEAAERGYEARQKVMEETHASIAHESREYQEAFWGGWYS